MTIEFKPATREASYARIALTGPSGSGKTYTALALAHGLAINKVAVVDTERGSASKYVGLNGWRFDTVQPDSFSPKSLVDILAAASAGNYNAIVIDSLSHYWMGVDGMLEQADRHAVRGNTFAGWKEVRPDERRMIDALVSYPGHVIVTMRSKTEYVIEDNDRGKKTPRKVGMKPEQREGIEYEFDLVGDLDYDNTLTVSKSRIHTLAKAIVPLPGEELAAQISDWLSEGEKVPTVAEYRKRALAAGSVDELKALFDEVSSHRLAPAPTTDADGNTGVLGDLIKHLASQMKAAPSDHDAAQQTLSDGLGAQEAS
ncbi:AAA-ATPase [Gordonia phage Squiddly]|nr:AAA-ATPase [Gordonia phage Squiddly]